MKTSLVLFLIAIAGMHIGYRGDKSSISGIVKEESGDPVIFAAVSLYHNGVLIKGTETDFDGQYSFTNIDTGTYVIEVTYVGFTPQREVGVVVKNGNPVTLDFTLKAGVTLDCVEILEYKTTMVKSDRAYPSGKKTARDIRNLPTKSVDALSSKTAGMTPPSRPRSDEIVEEISIRGSRTNATEYYIDGVRVSGHENPILADQLEEEDELSRENYGLIQDNRFMEAVQTPLSTFSIDVDRAAYSNVRRFLQYGQKPPIDAVRIEEMVNYFDYEYEEPNDAPFSIYTEMHDCPWKRKHKLLHIGLQGQSLPSDLLPASNLVFLVDVSGSMAQPNKLPLVVSSFKILVDQLRAEDRIAIVVYAGSSGLVLPSTSGKEKTKIIAALDRLQAGGSTAGAAGIKLAYETARANFIRGGNNRVILATDGDFNVGVSSDAELVRIIETERETGIFLTVLGYGTGNYQEHKMQELADHGNGNHAYIDGISEAKKVFVNEFAGTLFTIAKDVKIQIEFNPKYVKSYRLIGYENRMLAAEDFNDDKKDAGEIGAGHTVTALYEIVPVGVNSDYEADVDPLKYQRTKSTVVANDSEEWLNIKFRYKLPDGDNSKLIEHPVSASSMTNEITDNFQWAAAIAAFGMILRESEYKGESTMDLVRSLAGQSIGEDKDGYRAEFLKLVEDADLLASKE